MIRFPVGGFVWHHFQYIAGLRQLGHEVTYFEDYGWPDSCYQPPRDVNSGDPSFGIAFLSALLQRYELSCDLCYLAEDGTAHGISRSELAARCRESDLYLNLSNLNWIPELRSCRRRVLIDTDPVFSQIGIHGAGGQFTDYHVRFTFGENVHQPGCTMPTGDVRWLPTRQPIVTDFWPVTAGHSAAPLTTVMSWNPMGAHRYEGQLFGGKALSFAPYVTLPRCTGVPMEIAINIRAKRANPEEVRARLTRGGWRVRDAGEVTQTPWSYQKYLQDSCAEFSVSKHGYVVTQCGWFSERSAAYLASGRPVVLQDTGFSKVFPSGEGLLAYRDRDEANAAITRLRENYDTHCRAARALAEEYFDSRRVLTRLLEQSL
jgi:hypothetical protein